MAFFDIFIFTAQLRRLYNRFFIKKNRISYSKNLFIAISDIQLSIVKIPVDLFKVVKK